METKKLLKELSESVCTGHIRQTLDIVKKRIENRADIKELYGNCLCATLKGKSDRTVLLEAHIDEIAFVVTAVDEQGFIKVNCAGGFDLRTLPSHIMTVHGTRDIPAVFCSMPPHLSKGEEKAFEDINDISLDTGLGIKAKETVSVGDFVTYRRDSKEIGENRFCGKSLDNRAGVAALLLAFDMLSKEELPCTVKFLFANAEEIGCRGAVTSAFATDCDEAVAVDVSFAAAPGIEPEHCGKLSGGAMIGVSPILSKAVSDRLISVAESTKIPYQREIMGGKTCTDADVLTLSKSGIPTGLASIPLRNMHTDAEVIDIGDVENTARLLASYVLEGDKH